METKKQIDNTFLKNKKNFFKKYPKGFYIEVWNKDTLKNGQRGWKQITDSTYEGVKLGLVEMMDIIEDKFFKYEKTYNNGG